MLETFNMAIPTKAIPAPTIPYIGAFISVRWKRSSEVEAGVGSRGGGGGRRPRWRRGSEEEVEVEVEAEAEFDVRVRISCGLLLLLVVVVVQASGFARGVSIPVLVYQSISVYLFPVSE